MEFELWIKFILNLYLSFLFNDSWKSIVIRMKTESQDSAENMQEMENSFDRKRHIETSHHWRHFRTFMCYYTLVSPNKWTFRSGPSPVGDNGTGIHLVDNRTYCHSSHILAWSHTLCNAGRCAYERGLCKLCKSNHISVYG